MQKIDLEDVKPKDACVDYLKRAFDEFRDFYINKKTNLVEEKYLCDYLCSVCHSKMYEKLFLKNGLNFLMNFAILLLLLKARNHLTSF